MKRTIAVIDFETTGNSPQGGGRATEIAAVLLRDGEIVGQYQSLMNTGAWIPDDRAPHRHQQRDGRGRTRCGQGHA